MSATCCTENTQAEEWTDAMEEQLKGVFERHTTDRSELIPILQEAQDALGYLPLQSMRGTAEFLKMPLSAVYGVVTFYAQFHLTPQGRHKIKVCQGTACHVRGAGKIVEAIQRKIGIEPGETSEDLEYSLEGVACFGSCALAPVLVVNGKVTGCVTPKQVTKILEELT